MSLIDLVCDLEELLSKLPACIKRAELFNLTYKIKRELKKEASQDER